MESSTEITLQAALRVAFQEFEAVTSGDAVRINMHGVPREWFRVCLGIGGYTEVAPDTYRDLGRIHNYAQRMNCRAKAIRLARVIDTIHYTSNIGLMTVKISHDKIDLSIKDLLAKYEFVFEWQVDGYVISWKGPWEAT